MLEAEPETFSVLTVYYKMNYEPKKCRQKTSDFYGRLGISWHETVVSYLPLHQMSDSANEEHAGIKHMYYDHICRNSSKQRAMAVIAIIELVRRRLK